MIRAGLCMPRPLAIQLAAGAQLRPQHAAVGVIRPGKLQERNVPITGRLEIRQINDPAAQRLQGHDRVGRRPSAPTPPASFSLRRASVAPISVDGRQAAAVGEADQQRAGRSGAVCRTSVGLKMIAATLSIADVDLAGVRFAAARPSSVEPGDACRSARRRCPTARDRSVRRGATMRAVQAGRARRGRPAVER